MPSRPIHSRRGTTLAESMIASVLLATCVVGITGSVTAAYQNQQYAEARRAAAGTGRKLMANLTSMPLDPVTTGQASLSDYQQVSNNSSSNAASASSKSALAALISAVTFNLVNLGVTTTTTTTTVTATGSTAPTILVDRRASLTGAASTTGDFAIVTVSVPMTSSTASSNTLTLKRLVTSVEASGNQTP